MPLLSDLDKLRKHRKWENVEIKMAIPCKLGNGFLQNLEE
jgi:hypothetical protein